MKYLTFIAIWALLTVAGHAGEQSPKAGAELRNSGGISVGHARLAETPAGVKMVFELSGLPPGRHGFHIHAAGSCEPPDFKSAGGHFNPHGKKHGTKNPQGMHAGDLSNLEVKPDGTASGELVLSNVTLGPGSASLLAPGGTALVIHADPDDEMTDPAGNAGARIACGVIVGE
jgi:Cu-Zn family superoxide dismutase